MITQEKIYNNLRPIIEACVGRLAMQILQTIKNKGTFSEAVTSTQKSVNDLGIDILQYICQEVDNVYDEQRDKHQVIIKHRCKKRSLLTSMGEITLERRLYLNKALKRFFFAVDDLLQLEKNSRIEQNMKVELIKNATLTSYGKASELVEHRVSRQTVHNLVKKVKTSDVTSKLASRKEVSNIYIEADEDHIHLQNGKSAEVRLVYVHEGVKPICKGRNQLENVRYFVSVDDDPDQIWNDVAHYLHITYSLRNAKVHISGDGAYWIKYSQKKIPNSEYHIDKFHIQKSATYIAKGNKSLRRQILRAMRLKNIELLDTVYKAQYLKYTEHTERKTLFGNYFYLRNNMNVYNLRNRCSAEGHISHVLSSRMSSRPMGWSLAGAERIARLRAYYFNNGDFSQLVAGAELGANVSNEINKSKFSGYEVLKDYYESYSYNLPYAVRTDCLTDEISLKLKEILKFSNF